MRRDYHFPFWRFPRPPWAKPLRGMTHYLISQELQAIEDYGKAATEALNSEDLQSAELFRHIRQEEEHHLEELRARLSQM